MVKLLVCLAIAILSGAGGAAEVTFATRVSDLWLRGEKARVLQIAEARLAKNDNDIVGLLLKREYQGAFSQVPEIYSTLDRLQSVANATSGDHFAPLRSLLIADIQGSRVVFRRLSEERLIGERPKGAMRNKPLPCLEIIEALEADGYVRASDLPPDILSTPEP
jgi:hypothetical protein